MKHVNLLLLDDSIQYYALLKEMLSNSYKTYHLSWVKTVGAAVQRLRCADIDLILVDNKLQYTETGFDLLRNDEFKASDVPAVFIAGQSDAYVAVKALKAGAYDYLVKDRFDTSRLIYAIDTTLKEHAYKLKKDANHVELIKLATTDSLTGLYNRRFFMEKLQDELQRYIRYKLPLSVAILDVDHFKRVNDEHGHIAGDYVLRELGRVLQESIRATDSCCRYGGEEFLVAFPNTDLRSCGLLGERLRDSIERRHFYYEHVHIPVTVSVGLAEAHREIDNPDMLLKLADKALYAAKKDGRNRVISYHYGAGL